MATRNGRISRIIAVAAAALFAVLAVAEAGSTGKSYSSAQKRKTPYDILRKARQEPQAAMPTENAEIGPIIAKARLRLASITPRLDVGYFAKQMQRTTLIKPPELREVPADAPPDPVFFTLDIDDRKVHGIVYRSTHRSKRAKLRLDTNGDGLLSDEREYVGTWLSIFQFSRVYESYYHLDIAEDGEIVEFRRAKPAFGTLDLGDESVDIRLWSDAGHQQLFSSNGKWRLPAGKYTAVELKLTETDSGGNKWLFDTERARGGSGAGELGAFEVRPDETTAFKIGPPFQIKTTTEKSRYGDTVVRFYLEGQAGELYVPGVKKNGEDVPEPQFQLIGETGQTLYSGQFEFA